MGRSAREKIKKDTLTTTPSGSGSFSLPNINRQTSAKVSNIRGARGLSQQQHQQAQTVVDKALTGAPVATVDPTKPDVKDYTGIDKKKFMEQQMNKKRLEMEKRLKMKNQMDLDKKNQYFDDGPGSIKTPDITQSTTTTPITPKDTKTSVQGAVKEISKPKFANPDREGDGGWRNKAFGMGRWQRGFGMKDSPEGFDIKANPAFTPNTSPSSSTGVSQLLGGSQNTFTAPKIKSYGMGSTSRGAGFDGERIDLMKSENYGRKLPTNDAKSELLKKIIK